LTSVAQPKAPARSNPPPNDELDEAKRLELYRLQVELRDCEQRAYDLFLQGLVKGTSHLSLGQEAIAAGLAAPWKRAISASAPIAAMLIRSRAACQWRRCSAN
jgi:TPP-dependent pyruvate/acetoin dehydrogenase alpha subunit